MRVGFVCRLISVCKERSGRPLAALKRESGRLTGWLARWLPACCCCYWKHLGKGSPSEWVAVKGNKAERTAWWKWGQRGGRGAANRKRSFAKTATTVVHFAGRGFREGLQITRERMRACTRHRIGEALYARSPKGAIFSRTHPPTTADVRRFARKKSSGRVSASQFQTCIFFLSRVKPCNFLNWSKTYFLYLWLSLFICCCRAIRENGKWK